MFGSVVVEVVVSMVFIYLLISILGSAVREALEGFVKSRAAYLEYAIREMLHDKPGSGLAAAFFRHPLVFGLFAGEYKSPKSEKKPWPLTPGHNMPSYIPPKIFAITLMDLAVRGKQTDEISSDSSSPALTIDAIRDNIRNIGNPEVQRLLLSAIDTAQGKLEIAIANVEEYYNGVMERLSGWYKRSSSLIVFGIGLFMAVGMNINSIRIADYLYQNDGVRGALVARAEAAAKDTATVSISYENAKRELEALSLPIGWGVEDGRSNLGIGRAATGKPNLVDWLVSIFGWLITAFAVNLGAPFWFDILSKVTVIRSTIKPLAPTLTTAEDTSRHASGVSEGRSGNGSGVTGDHGGRSGGVLPTVGIPSPRDTDSDKEACEIKHVSGTETSDHELPVAEGGVA